jgi:hypothetical protein
MQRTSITFFLFSFFPLPHSFAGTFAFLLNQAFNKHPNASGHKLLLTEVTEGSADPNDEGTDLVIFPDAIRYFAITKEKIPEFVETVLINKKPYSGKVCERERERERDRERERKRERERQRDREREREREIEEEMSSLSTSFFLFLSCFLSFRLLLLQNALF